MILRELLSTCPQVIEGNRFLVSIKGHNSVTNLRKMTGDNPNLDIVDMNAYIKLGEILSICFQIIEQIQNSDVNQGP